MASDSLPEHGRLRRRALHLAPIRYRLLHTWPGRLVVVGGPVKLAAWLLRAVAGVNNALVDAVGSLGSLALIIGLAYFAWHLIVRAKRRLLWRVRRKLILSYIFVGVVPVLLVFAFFILAGLLLFLNFGSYAVALALGQVTERAESVAQRTASEIARAGQASAREMMVRELPVLAERYPGASLALVPTPAEPCGGTAVVLRPRAASKQAPETSAPARPQAVTVGPWAHLPAPQVLPAWVSCSGFAGFIAVVPTTGGASQRADDNMGLVIRAVGLPDATQPAFAVIVDIPVDSAVKSMVRDDTTVKIDRVSRSQAHGEVARPATDGGPNAGALFSALTEERQTKSRLPWFTVVDWVDWTSGASDKATVWIVVNVYDIFDRVSSEQSAIRGYRGASGSGGRAGLAGAGLVLVGMLALFAILFVIIEVVALVMGLVLARSITGSVHQLFTGTERVRQGDFSHKIKILTNDQMGELAESFNSMTASIEDLLRQAQEKKRMEEELRIARAIQMSLLPRGQLAVSGLSITALCVPAREVGGDYYDLLPLEGNRLGVLIADVAGKGTSAALYMAELKGLILSLSRIHTSPRRLLIEANRIIANNLDSRSFITMTYAVIDLRARTMAYARAGHTPLIHRTRNGDAADVEVLAPDGLVLGLQMDDGGALFERLLKEETIALREGDLLMFFTDGITEAMNADSDCFGESRLGEILAEHGDLPSEELRERILREIDAFVAGAPQHDDMTMILIKVEAIGAAMAGEAALVTRTETIRGIS